MKIFEFIAQCRQAFAKISRDNENLFTFVIGNQSADLDSIVSAIGLAYYKNNTIINNKRRYLPVVNNTREILESKEECKYLFDYHKINMNDLIFLNDLISSNKSELTFEKSSIILVDHNKLDEHERKLKFENHITGVIDHHLDENLYAHSCTTEMRLIDNTIASNAFLITELMKNDSAYKFEEPSLATLLLFAILIDTDNMSPDRSRITVRDQSLFDFLLQRANITSSEAMLAYNKIQELKVNSANNKTVDLLLRNDYKQWTCGDGSHGQVRYGISSILIAPNVWIEKETKSKWLSDIRAYINKNSLDLFAILAVYNDTNGALARDLFIFSAESMCKAFLEYPENATDLRLQGKLQLDERVLGVWTTVVDAKKTRKFWQPRINECLECFLRSNKTK